MLYAITASRRIDCGIGSTPSAYVGAKQLPMFFLDADVQGIASADHAVRIARAIIGNAFNVHAEPVHH